MIFDTLAKVLGQFSRGCDVSITLDVDFLDLSNE